MTCTPSLHDPARTPTTRGADRAARRARYSRMTPAQIVAEMPAGTLQRNIRRGAQLAIAEGQRRALAAMHTWRHRMNASESNRFRFDSMRRG